MTRRQTNTTADFGYYAQPAALGNFVWDDLTATASRTRASRASRAWR